MILQSSTLDYCEVVYSLCEVLILVYSKFLDPSCALPMYVDAILKVDAKIKVRQLLFQIFAALRMQAYADMKTLLSALI